MIEIKNVTKSFGSNKVLRGITLNIETGKTTVIIGASGCGKSVLLKNIIGLLMPDSGEILVDGEDITKMKGKELFRVRNKFGFLFQNSALFDSMTVEQNIALGLVENTHKPKDEIDKIVARNLELVKLPGIQKKKPSELSGGMKKRVGLARALACEPQCLLYDEPTTGLDPITSIAIDKLIHDLANELKVTSVVVTHDILSVYEVADWVAMIYEGVVHWQGTPSDLKTTEDKIVREFLERTEGTDTKASKIIN